MGIERTFQRPSSEQPNTKNSVPTVDMQLFPDDRLNLPEWRQGETLYSWCAHYHFLASNIDSRFTSRQLFGDPRAGLRYDFPICLNSLTHRTDGALGSRDQVLLEITPFRGFVRFVDETRLKQVLGLMESGREYHLALKLGLLRNGFGAPLKACPECLSESLDSENSTSWQIDHQLPGVYICERHTVPLLVATADALLRARREFVLPHSLKAHEWHQSISLSTEAKALLQRLSVWTRAMAASTDSPTKPFDSVTLRDTCHLRTLEKNLVGIDGSLDFKAIRKLLHEEYADLVNIPGLEFLDDAQKESGGFAGLLLRKYNGTHHPLMHCALLSFLFESPAEFFNAYVQAAKCDPARRRDSLRAERSELCRRLADLVSREQMSVNQASQLLGIDPARAIALLVEMEVPYETRPRIVGTEIERKLVERLETGEEPALVSSTLSIRRGFIRDYLATRPELRRRHSEKLFCARREAYRTKFLKILASNPSLPIKRIRRETDSGFEWLYRNDRDWLAENLPGIWHR